MSKYGVFSGPYFPAFGLLSLRIQSDCGKIQTKKISVFGHFSGSLCTAGSHGVCKKKWLFHKTMSPKNLWKRSCVLSPQGKIFILKSSVPKKPWKRSTAAPIQIRHFVHTSQTPHPCAPAYLYYSLPLISSIPKSIHILGRGGARSPKKSACLKSSTHH